MSDPRIRSVRLEEPVAAKAATPAIPAAKPSGLELPLTAFAFLLALWVLATTINIARIGWVPIPISDDWDRWMTYVANHFSLYWFFRQHADHRLVVPKALFEIDHFGFHARGWFLLLCAFILQFLTAILLWRLARGVCRQERRERWILAAAIIACLFSGQQWFNFVMPFQVQFPLVYFGVTAAIFFLWKAVEQPPRRSLWIVSAIIAVTVACYSMANGVLLWPVLLVAGFWLGLRGRWIAILAAGAVLFGSPFFYHWNKSSEPIYDMAGTERLWRTVIFWFGHLGSPVLPLAVMGGGDTFRLRLAVIVGGLLALILLAAFVMLLRRPEQFTSARTLLLFYCGFLALTSATMAYGRSGTSLMEVYTPRYLTPSYIFWVCLLLVVWPWLRNIRRVWLYGMVCFAILAGVAAHQRDVTAVVRDWRQTVRPAELALVDNVTDPYVWTVLYHDPSIAIVAADYLRENRLGIFTEEWTHWPGVPLNHRFFVDRNPDACQGQVEDIVLVPSPLRSGWRLGGWAWDVKAGRPPRYVVLADSDGLVAGVALTGFPQAAVFDALSQQYLASPWMGYVNGRPRPITAYVLEADDRSLCAIGSRVLPRMSRDVAFTEMGPAFPDARPEIAGAWIRDGYYQGRGGPGAPPSTGPVFGTFPDSSTGTMRLGPFHLDGHTDMAIPMVTGPDSQNLLVVLRDVATQEVIEKMEPPPLRINWWAWRPEIPLGREMNVELVLTDRGTGWGQWLAVGWPHAVKPKP